MSECEQSTAGTHTQGDGGPPPGRTEPSDLSARVTADYATVHIMSQGSRKEWLTFYPRGCPALPSPAQPGG